MAKRHSAEQWEQWISKQQKSALSVRDFCDGVGVPLYALPFAMTFRTSPRVLATEQSGVRTVVNSCRALQPLA